MQSYESQIIYFIDPHPETTVNFMLGLLAMDHLSKQGACVMAGCLRVSELDHGDQI